MKAILVLMLSVLLGGLIALTTGCTELNMGTQVLFEGPLMVQSKSSDIFAIYYTRVKDCMGVSKPLPLPDVKIIDGNGVMCGDNVGFGCYHNDYRKGTIIIPIETNPIVIKHEFIHHILFLTLPAGFWSQYRGTEPIETYSGSFSSLSHRRFFFPPPLESLQRVSSNFYFLPD